MTDERSALFSLVLLLSPTAPATLPATMGHQAHAAFLDAIRAVDPALSAALHAEGAAVRPFTVSPLLGAGRPADGRLALAPEREYALRCTILDGLVYERFMARFLRSEERPVIRLGRAELLVKEVRVTPGSHPGAGYTSWARLAAEARPEPLVTLAFTSPTAFGFGQRRWGKQVVVLPEPRLVFGSLVRTWNALAPAALRIDAQALRAYLEENAVLTHIDHLRTEMLQFQEAPQLGFLGQVTFGFMGDDQGIRCQLNALADFAFYAGVGMKTAMGMGQCRRVGRSASVLEG